MTRSKSTNGDACQALKIAFVSQYFYPEQFSNNEIVRHLVQQGHSVDVICCVPNYGQDKFFDGYSNKTRASEEWNGARVHRAWTVARGKGKLRLMLNYVAFPFFGSLRAFSVYRGQTPPDVVFVSMPSPLFQAFVGLVIKARYGARCVYWVQDLWPESLTLTLGLRNPLLVRPLSWICGWLYRKADTVLVQSAGFPERIERFGVSAAKIAVLPNTAPETYVPLNPDPNWDETKLMQAGRFKLVFAGNIGESQDIEGLIDAFARLDDGMDAHFYIIGSGRNLENVKARVFDKELEDRITFLGRHPEDRMPNFFANADALIVALKDKDIFSLTVPYKVQCYMACGRPIIAMLNGEGARIIQRSGGGFVTPAEDVGELEKSLKRFCALSDGERVAMGQAARRWFDIHYSKTAVFGALEVVLAGDAP
ncbi:glycosyltransferase family 4 protein [Roseovarius sp. CH_XMU1461]|uniref:glycosyltransferase family 4 protein n=1 Tax=Roseovarius sp. CH_XMU1461 TaxID=3107777 RepID=UPI00300A88DB